MGNRWIPDLKSWFCLGKNKKGLGNDLKSWFCLGKKKKGLVNSSEFTQSHVGNRWIPDLKSWFCLGKKKKDWFQRKPTISISENATGKSCFLVGIYALPSSFPLTAMGKKSPHEVGPRLTVVVSYTKTAEGQNG